MFYAVHLQVIVSADCVWNNHISLINFVRICHINPWSSDISKKLLSDARSEIYIIRRNIVSTGQSARALKKNYIQAWWFEKGNNLLLVPTGFIHMNSEQFVYHTFIILNGINERHSCCILRGLTLQKIIYIFLKPLIVVIIIWNSYIVLHIY